MDDKATYLTDDQARKLLRQYIRSTFRTQGDAARDFGVSHRFMSKVLNGRCPMTKAIADRIGLDRARGWITRSSSPMLLVTRLEAQDR